MNDENLTPFPPGNNANPKGRPVGSRNRSTVLRELLALAIKDVDLTTGKECTMTVEQSVIQSLIKQALKGDISAIKEIQDTNHGKIVDKSEVLQKIVKMDNVLLDTPEGPKELTYDLGSTEPPKETE